MRSLENDMRKFQIGDIATTKRTNFMFIRWIYNIDNEYYYYIFNLNNKSYTGLYLDCDQEHYSDIFRELKATS